MSEKNTYTRDFSEILNEIGGGRCTRELNEKLQQVTQACRDTGKKGAVTLKIEIKPKGAQFLVDGKVSGTVPEMDTQPTIMFADYDYNLTRKDPRQMNLSEAVSVGQEEKAIQLDGDDKPAVRLEDNE